MSKTNKRCFMKHPPSKLIVELRPFYPKGNFILIIHRRDLVESSSTLIISVGNTKLQCHQHSVPKPAICWGAARYINSYQLNRDLF